MTPSRETIMEALRALIATATGIVTVSRRVRLWSEVPAAEQPAVFLAEHGDAIERQSETARQKSSIGADLFVYTRTDNPDAIPATALNNALDAIETALAPKSGTDLVTNRQTLGGLVSHCYIDGTIFKDPGDLDGGQSVAVVPVKILVP